MSAAVPERVVIAGLGLMGGSVAHALARLPARPHVIGIDRDSGTIRRALDSGIIDGAAETAEHLSADLLVLALPVRQIIDTLAAAKLDGYACITDVGSVKAAVQAAAERGGVAARFAGAHPLCGDHRSGFGAARADLYDGSVVYVCSDAAAALRAQVAAFWQLLGGRPVEVTASVHDALLAATSHLPQLVASALAGALHCRALPAALLGPGGADTTRIAASNASLWTEIITHNREEVLTALSHFDTALDAIRDAVDSADAQRLHVLLEVAAAWRSARDTSPEQPT